MEQMEIVDRYTCDNIYQLRTELHVQISTLIYRR